MTGQRATDTGTADRQRGLLLALAVVLLYVSAHAVFRIIASQTLGEDDTLDQILVQDLRLGYNPRQPPLYDWVLWTVQQVTGTGVVSFLLIKYAALTATVAFLYLAAYRILADRVWALLTVEALALIYQIAWRYHEGFTHEVLAMVAVAATLWAFLRLYDRPSIGNHVLFGVICGLGMLTEPNYTVYQSCLWIAVGLQPAIRARVVSWRLLISAAIALATASPFIAWVLSDSQHLAALWRDSGKGPLRERLIGVKDAVRGPFMYLAPLIVILPLVFRGFIATAWSDVKAAWPLVARAGAAPDLERLVMTTMLAGVALSIAGGLLLGIGGYAMHVLMPLYVTSVIWLFAVARRSPGAPARIDTLGRLALAIAVLALVARLANMFVLDPVCGKCRWGIPYAALAQELRTHGVGDRATFLVVDNELGGNLRAYFPDARFVMRGPHRFTPERRAHQGAARVAVWGANTPDQSVAALLDGEGVTAADVARAARFSAPWQHLWKPDGYRTSDWRFVLIP